jgi:hypothetical protein
MRILFALPVLLSLSCAMGGGSSASFARSIAIASRPDAMERGLKVVALYHYDVLKVEEQPDLLIETNWRTRPPFEDETALGIADAETRLLIVGRKRGETNGLGTNYDINLTIENRVRPPGTDDWTETVHTPMFRKYADEITNLYKRELQIGVRRY